jgi:hypothetical protein
VFEDYYTKEEERGREPHLKQARSDMFV